MSPHPRRIDATRALLTAASVVVVVAGLQAAKVVLVPVLFAILLAVLGSAPVAWLRRRNIPAWLSVFLVSVAAALGLVVLAIFVQASVAEIRAASPRYQRSLEALVDRFDGWLSAWGISIRELDILDVFERDAIIGFLTSATQWVFALASSALLVVILMSFVLAEATSFRLKTTRALGEEPGLENFVDTFREMQRYLGVKTLTSLLTGGLVLIWVRILEVDFPFLWGFLAFLLNYIPVLGSIIAAVPPILLVLLDRSLGSALVVSSGYLVINIGISNFLEPILMGRRLGLSPLVVLLSIVFWGWIWGPLGMLLSVPLTRMVKILLENTRQLHWIATFMGGRPRLGQAEE